MEKKNKFMDIAVKLAKKSLKFEDIPVGCVITNSNNKIIGKGYNSCIKNNDPSAHAELLAIRMACKREGSLILDTASLYVTLEPCMMCEHLIKEARIKKVFFGAYNLNFRKKKLVYNSRSNIFFSESKYGFYGGFNEEECSNLLKNFFSKLRK